MNRSQMRKITKELAKSNHVSVTEVKREMQAAMNAAYVKPTPAGLAVPQKGNIPTPQEFIDYTAKTMIKQKHDNK